MYGQSLFRLFGHGHGNIVEGFPPLRGWTLLIFVHHALNAVHVADNGFAAALADEAAAVVTLPDAFQQKAGAFIGHSDCLDAVERGRRAALLHRAEN